ncbi:MAG: TetR/AcrR family transcriptional regulator [Bacteroidota bacterium]
MEVGKANYVHTFIPGHVHTWLRRNTGADRSFQNANDAADLPAPAMPRAKAFDETAILDRAADLFWDRGYEAVSIQDLVDHLGLSRSSLYDTFGGKQALYLAALDRYRLAGAQETDPLQMLIEETGSPRAAIEAFLRAVVSDAVANCLGCFVVNATTERAPHDPETAQRVRDSLEALQARFERGVRLAQDAGEVASDRDAQALGRVFANTVYGLRVTARVSPDRAVLDDVVEQTMRLLG